MCLLGVIIRIADVRRVLVDRRVGLLGRGARLDARPFSGRGDLLLRRRYGRSDDRGLESLVRTRVGVLVCTEVRPRGGVGIEEGQRRGGGCGSDIEVMTREEQHDRRECEDVHEDTEWSTAVPPTRCGHDDAGSRQPA
jgi:hypothetical protein